MMAAVNTNNVVIVVITAKVRYNPQKVKYFRVLSPKRPFLEDKKDNKDYTIQWVVCFKKLARLKQ